MDTYIIHFDCLIALSHRSEQCSDAITEIFSPYGKMVVSFQSSTRFLFVVGS